jgi:hypothetical protein
MSHLSRERLLEAVEAEPSPDAAAHLQTCWRCRAEVEALRGTLRKVRAVDVPEPSPLFWDHLTARVREAIAAEPTPDRARVPVRPWWRPVLAALLVLVSAVLVDRGVRMSRAPAAPAATAARSTPATDRTGDWDLDAGADWQFIVELATMSAVHEDETAEAEEIDTHVGAADLGMSELSADEQRALVKLLNEAIAEGGAAPRTVKGDV